MTHLTWPDAVFWSAIVLSAAWLFVTIIRKV